MPYAIRKVGDKFCLFLKDGNKRIGCHPTKAEAIAQRQAIEIRKHARSYAAAGFDESKHPRGDHGRFEGGLSGGEDKTVAQLDGHFPPAGNTLDGFTVGDHVPNESSIESSLTSYEALPGVREVSMHDMDPQYQPKPYSTAEAERLDKLQAQIDSTRHIDPLIVVVDQERHPYVLEGGHRYDALRRLGVKKFPAKIVVDTSSVKLKTAAGFDEGQHARDEHGRWTAGGGGQGKKLDTTAEADSWGAKTQGWAKDLTLQEKAAIDNYTVSVGLNETLRAGKDPEASQVHFVYRDGNYDDQNVPKLELTEKTELEGLDSVFAKPDAVLGEDVVTYRAWSGKGQPGGKKEGSTFVDKGFTSTAMSKDEIETFLTDPNTLRVRGTRVEIHAPKGTRAIYLGTKPDGAKWYAGSSELLINRGTRYKVISNKTTGKDRHMILQVVS